MSIYEPSILAFIEVVKSGLIPPEDWADLVNLADHLPKDEENILEAIDRWVALPSRQLIRNQWQQLQKTPQPESAPTHMGPAGSKSQKDLVEAAVDRSLGDQLKNEIIRHQPVNFPNLDSTNQPPKTK